MSLYESLLSRPVYEGLLSRPVRLHWAGWETTTTRLQQAGWSLSAEQDMREGRMRIALRHQGYQLYGITERVDHDYFHDPVYEQQRSLELRVAHMASRLTAEFVETGLPSFAPIDATPQFFRRERTSIEDFAHFAPPLVRTKEIILPEEGVAELMERILKLQEPAKVEYLKRTLAADRAGLMIEAHPRQKFHAQILSIAA